MWCDPYLQDLDIWIKGTKLSPGGLRQFTLSPIRDYDRTQELGLSLLGRVPMPASYPHRDTSLVYSYYHNIHIYSLRFHTSFLRFSNARGSRKVVE